MKQQREDELKNPEKYKSRFDKEDDQPGGSRAESNQPGEADKDKKAGVPRSKLSRNKNEKVVQKNQNMSKDTKKDTEPPKSNASGNNKAFKFRTLDENAEEKNSIDVKSNDKDSKECSSKDFNKDQVPKDRS